METASSLISNNSNRFKKKLWSSANQGELVKLNCYRTGKEEAQGVSDIIEKKLKKKFSLNDVSILVRAIYQTREFEERFLKIGIGYRVLGGIMKDRIKCCLIQELLTKNTMTWLWKE